MIRYLLLGLLRDGIPRHGYALAKRYRERSGCRMSIGNVYRELQRLAADGWVRAVANPTDADPRRAPYEITESGRDAFDAWLAGRGFLPSADRQDEIAVRGFLLAHAAHVRAERILEQWVEELTLRRRACERMLEVALQENGTEQLREELMLFLTRRARHLAVDLEFLAELRLLCRRHEIGSGERGSERFGPARAGEPKGSRSPVGFLGGATVLPD